MDQINEFKEDCLNRIKSYADNKPLKKAANDFMCKSTIAKYSYNYSWMGRPIIQYPQDIVAMQEIIWEIKPDLIIETGIAHGGSLIFYASILTLLELSGLVKNPKVLGIDIDIRKHNKEEIEKHPMFNKIEMIEGSSIDKDIAKKVVGISKGFQNIMVILDSNHTHDHVLKELELYAQLVTKESYCVVFDTIIEDMPENNYPDRPWYKGNNPKTAVWEYLKSYPEFVIDKNIENKLLITVAPDGYLKRVK